MKIEQVGAQLYTIRDHIKTSQDIRVSLQKIRDIGYRAVQVSGMGPIEESELLEMCNDLGLTICATHEATTRILDEPEQIVERLKKLDCRYTAVPSPGTRFETIDEVKAFAARMNQAGRVLAENDCVLLYHNHAMEFARIDGQMILEIFYDSTDARYLQGEIDTYWVQYGGGDPVAWCQRLQDRLPVIHLKDYQAAQDNKVTFCEIGQGNLDMVAIIAAAENSGCEWLVVEQDTTPGDPFDSLKISFDWLQAHLNA